MRETTVLELQHAVRPGRERAIVRHDHHAQLELVRELGEQLVQPLAVVMVEISRRLVGEEHGRIGGQGTRDSGALLLPARQRARAMMHAPAQPENVEPACAAAVSVTDVP